MEFYKQASCEHLFYKHSCPNVESIPRYLRKLCEFTQTAKQELENIESINGFPKLDGIYIDGTAACLKSTILSHGNYQITKYNHVCEISEINTSNSGMLQYIIGSYMCIRDYPQRVWDRSFINNLDWSIIWLALDAYNKCSDSDEGLKAAAKVIWMLANSKMYKALQSVMPGVYIIDRNTSDVYARMMKRAEGSDVSRCEIRGYVEVQNLAYIIFSSAKNNVLVDLTNFGDLGRSNVSIGIFHHFFAPYKSSILALPKRLGTPMSNAISQIKTHLERAIRKEMYQYDTNLEPKKIVSIMRMMEKKSSQPIIRRCLANSDIKVYKSTLKNKSKTRSSTYFTVNVGSKILDF